LVDVALLGLAFQRGLVPVSLDAMESAVRRAESGGVGRSVEAFNFGRRMAAGVVVRRSVEERESTERLVRRLALELVRERFGGRRRAARFALSASGMLAAFARFGDGEDADRAARAVVTALHRSIVWGGTRMMRVYEGLIAALLRADPSGNLALVGAEPLAEADVEGEARAEGERVGDIEMEAVAEGEDVAVVDDDDAGADVDAGGGLAVTEDRHVVFGREAGSVADVVGVVVGEKHALHAASVERHVKNVVEAGALVGKGRGRIHEQHIAGAEHDAVRRRRRRQRRRARVDGADAVHEIAAAALGLGGLDAQQTCEPVVVATGGRVGGHAREHEANGRQQIDAA
jgi:hypothetical protein